MRTLLWFFIAFHVNHQEKHDEKCVDRFLLLETLTSSSIISLMSSRTLICIHENSIHFFIFLKPIDYSKSIESLLIRKESHFHIIYWCDINLWWWKTFKILAIWQVVDRFKLINMAAPCVWEVVDQHIERPFHVSLGLSYHSDYRYFVASSCDCFAGGPFDQLFEPYSAIAIFSREFKPSRVEIFQASIPSHTCNIDWWWALDEIVEVESVISQQHTFQLVVFNFIELLHKFYVCIFQPIEILLVFNAGLLRILSENLQPIFSLSQIILQSVQISNACQVACIRWEFFGDRSQIR